jgi:hypothetical protein
VPALIVITPTQVHQIRESLTVLKCIAYQDHSNARALREIRQIEVILTDTIGSPLLQSLET